MILQCKLPSYSLRSLIKNTALITKLWRSGTYDSCELPRLNSKLLWDSYLSVKLLFIHKIMWWKFWLIFDVSLSDFKCTMWCGVWERSTQSVHLRLEEIHIVQGENNWSHRIFHTLVVRITNKEENLLVRTRYTSHLNTDTNTDTWVPTKIYDFSAVSYHRNLLQLNLLCHS